MRIRQSPARVAATATHHESLRLFVIVNRSHRNRAVSESGPGPHLHRNEHGFGDLLVGRPQSLGCPRVPVDAPRALGDVCDRDRYEVLDLARKNIIREHNFTEVDKSPGGFRFELTQPLSMFVAIFQIEISHGVLSRGRPAGRRV